MKHNRYVSLIIHNGSKNDILIIDNLMQITGIIDYSIIDISKDDCLPEEKIIDSMVIIFKDNTKTKSLFDKKLESMYPNILNKKEGVYYIPKPSTLIKNYETFREVWGKISDVVKDDIFNIDLNLLPENIYDFYNIIKSAPKGSERFNIKMKDKTKVEIYPDHLKPQSAVSISYKELTIMLAIKALFKLEDSIITMVKK